MRSRRLRGRRRSADLKHDNGLGQGNFPRCGKKRPGITDGLHINDDAARIRIISQVVNKIAPANIEH
jgi:hypothetical protein